MTKIFQNYIVNGIIQMLLSLYWIWHFGKLLYLYHYTNVLFPFRYPNWILILYIVMGLLVFLTGLSVLYQRLKIKTGYLIVIGLFIIVCIIDLIIIQ